MVRVKMNGDGSIHMIDEGNVFLFDRAGKFVDTVARTPNITNNMKVMPIVSILSTSGGTEVGVFFEDDTKETFFVKEDAMDVAMTVQMLGEFVKILRKDGEIEGVKYNQLVFIYRNGVDISRKVKGLTRN